MLLESSTPPRSCYRNLLQHWPSALQILSHFSGMGMPPFLIWLWWLLFPYIGLTLPKMLVLPLSVLLRCSSSYWLSKDGICNYQSLNYHWKARKSWIPKSCFPLESKREIGCHSLVSCHKINWQHIPHYMQSIQSPKLNHPILVTSLRVHSLIFTSTVTVLLWIYIASAPQYWPTSLLVSHHFPLQLSLANHPAPTMSRLSF